MNVGLKALGRHGPHLGKKAKQAAAAAKDAKCKIKAAAEEEAKHARGSAAEPSSGTPTKLRTPTRWRRTRPVDDGSNV
jgi:hypothetical protein